MHVLIPSYEPDERLLRLIEQLKEICSFPILVVDDGSREAYRDIFHSVRELGCTVITHGTNKGKGRALKTGFEYLNKKGETDGVVCADSDGQHLPADIVKIAGAVHEHQNHIILGCRRFTGKVPLRSRFGNAATRQVYSFATGNRIYERKRDCGAIQATC